MVAIYLDSANLGEMGLWHDKVEGYTTNPTLMRKAGVTDFLEFAKAALHLGKPISLEVTSDDPVSMEAQARRLAALAPNVVVKIPITNTRGEYSRQVLDNLCRDGIKVNVTAVMTEEQIQVAAAYSPEIISVFCGRIADTGRQPPRVVRRNSKALWASARQVYDAVLAEEMGYDIITFSPDLLSKLNLFGKDLTQYSLETVQQFFNDAQKAGYVF